MSLYKVLVTNYLLFLCLWVGVLVYMLEKHYSMSPWQLAALLLMVSFQLVLVVKKLMDMLALGIFLLTVGLMCYALLSESKGLTSIFLQAILQEQKKQQPEP